MQLTKVLTGTAAALALMVGGQAHAAYDINGNGSATVNFDGLNGGQNGTVINVTELGVDVTLQGDSWIDDNGGNYRLQLEGEGEGGLYDNSFLFSSPMLVTELTVGAERGGSVGDGVIEGEIFGLLGGAEQWKWEGTLEDYEDVMQSEDITGSIGNDVDEIRFLKSDGNLFDVDQFTIIPEPASLALLGVGGLALLGRRRRTA